MQVVKVDLANEPKGRGFGGIKYEPEKLEIGEGFYIQQINGKPKLPSIKAMCHDWGHRFEPKRKFRYQDQNNGTVLVWRTHDPVQPEAETEG